MDLRTYRQLHGIAGLRALAKRVGSSYDYLYQLAQGYRQPSMKLALKLEEATKGEITRRALRPELYRDIR